MTNMMNARELLRQGWGGWRGDPHGARGRSGIESLLLARLVETRIELSAR